MSGAALKTQKSLEEGRGSMDSQISKSGEVAVVRWNDNKCVNVASTFVGIGTVEKVRQWNKKDKEFIEVDRPEAIKVYNDYMGGVDMDFLISLYPMNSRTKRWPTRVIMHLLSLGMVNAWLEYQDRERVRGHKRKEILYLLGFRNVVALKAVKPSTSKRSAKL